MQDQGYHNESSVPVDKDACKLVLHSLTTTITNKLIS